MIQFPYVRACCAEHLGYAEVPVSCRYSLLCCFNYSLPNVCRAMAPTSTALMNTTRGNGQGIREAGGDGCTLLMGPSMKESGHMASDMARGCFSCVSLSLAAGT